MTELFVAETRKQLYSGESASHCEACGEPIPEARRKAIVCRYCVACQNEMEKRP